MKQEDKNKYWRERYKNPIHNAAHRKSVKAWREKNLEKMRKYGRDYARAHPLEGRKAWLRRKYGISLESYEVLLQSQNGVCATCGGTNKDNMRNKYLCVDHDHSNGRVRGLLCHGCNASIGYAKEDTATLAKMIDYLNKHNA